MITQNKLKEMLEYNRKTGIFKWKIKNIFSKMKAGDVAGCKDGDGYISICINGKHYKAHRLAILYVDGYTPEGSVDHKDRIKHHNWYSNLREASSQCQSRNMGLQKNNTSGIKGISRKKSGKWQATIYINGKTKFLGNFSNKLEAAYTRYAAEQCLNWDECDKSSSTFKYIEEAKRYE